MEQFKAPSPLSLTGNSADNWHRFKDHCSAQKNVVFERYQYWSHQMTAGTSVNRLIAELRHRSKDCEFGISEHDMLRDKLVLSITDSHLKKRLIQERGLTLHRAIEICRATEQEKTEHGVEEVPVDDELKMILPDQSLHHNTRRQLGSQSVPNTDQTETLVLAAFTPKVHVHRLQLHQPSVTDGVFSERKNVEQLLPESLHIKEEKQLCVQQETNSAACPVKCEEEEEKPQASQLHWRQLTEINIKEEPSTCTLDEFMERQSVGINNKGPEAAQNPDPRCLVLQGPDGPETDSPQAVDRSEDDDYDDKYDDDDDDDDDEGCWQKPLSESETEADFDSTRKKRKMSDSSKNAEMGCKASKTRISSFQQICSKKKVQVKMTSECVGGKKASLSTTSKQRIHTGEKPFKCMVCRKCYHKISHLKEHMRIHTGEKPFNCDKCSQCFTRKVFLQSHMRIHTGEKPFKCDICWTFFYKMSHLKEHTRIHTGEKPFKCDKCSQCFARKVHLKQHMRVHTGEKPFKCDACRKCFTRKVHLKQHMRIHTGVKPFKCDVCSTFFARKDYLQSHVRIHKV